ncbi:hypothetical protein [Homoserinibacter sp. GY 40078]|uniref:hypothetical protein n=1 Tax=Homoserinibacter sp. GY 40078 TaxID=2603275 RepID=UPI0011CCA4E6|nr:hypothetical protein [Homoserinibacter sp. GY 40078]TXK17653.1 hypothetical protein FVQ89_12660 [Homoserinibacter sp. GY 40078]
MAAERVVVSERMAIWRAVLVGVGVLLLATGVGAFLTEVRPGDYPGVAAWLLGALVLHDGVAAMVLFAATVIVRRIDDRVPFVVLAIAQAAAVVAVIVTVLVVPEIVKQAIGTANPTILPLDYLGNLLLVLAGILAATAAAIVVALLLRRRGSRSRGTS